MPEHPLRSAVLETVAYSDVYSWPLTAREIHRFLPVKASRAEVLHAVGDAVGAGLLGEVAGHYPLAGREQSVASRRHREAVSARMWPAALRCGRILARLPWTRMVAVSGSLAVGAARDGDDIDLFIVTDDGRLWLTRALAVALVRAAPGPTLCPNYLVSVSNLEMESRDLYTAHELAQLVPIAGASTYAALMERNRWYREYLPNHHGHAGTVPGLKAGHVRRTLAPLLDGPLVSRAERWEMRRKVARFTARTSNETRFDAVSCKGHFDGHRRRFLDAFDARLRLLEARR